jgi:Kef-type K+ transport system membrane component KefB/mannitol/fructose-specific phosphotransferase system IIA component (Ntr-type)
VFPEIVPPCLLAPLAGSGGMTAETRLFLALAILLIVGRTLGEVARRLGQPSVVGELFAGILLGPAVMGRLWPEGLELLFPKTGASATTLDGVRQLGLALFLLVAGMEVDLSRVLRQGRALSYVGAFGLLGPLAIGFGVATFAPHVVGYDGRLGPGLFALFFATALSISALPVIAKTLMDLYLYRSDFGMTVIAAAVLDDIVGWLLFAVVLSLIGASTTSPFVVVGLTVASAALFLTVGRWAIHRVLPFVQAHTSWPAGVLVFSIGIALIGAAVADYAGVHAVFGAFLAGVALGDSSHLRERTRATITDFVSSFFVPLFFAGVGLRVDFLANFDLQLCAIVTLLACAAKIAGCGFGALVAGMPKREALATGLAMNARGSMEIILALTALQLGMIGEELFVALVVMALSTSMLAGPLIRRVLDRAEPRRFARYLAGRGFLPRMASKGREAAVRELATAAARASGIKEELVAAAAWAREELGTTAMGEGIAVPHARLDGLRQPVVALGLSPDGIEFDAPDHKPVRICFLILTPKDSPATQLEILADIGSTLKDPELREKLVAVRGYTELLALLRADGRAR